MKGIITGTQPSMNLYQVWVEGIIPCIHPSMEGPVLRFGRIDDPRNTGKDGPKTQVQTLNGDIQGTQAKMGLYQGWVEEDNNRYQPKIGLYQDRVEPIIPDNQVT